MGPRLGARGGPLCNREWRGASTRGTTACPVWDGAARRGAVLRHGVRDGCPRRNHGAVKVEKPSATTAALLCCDRSSQRGIMCVVPSWKENPKPTFRCLQRRARSEPAGGADAAPLRSWDAAPRCAISTRSVGPHRPALRVTSAGRAAGGDLGQARSSHLCAKSVRPRGSDRTARRSSALRRPPEQPGILGAFFGRHRQSGAVARMCRPGGASAGSWERSRRARTPTGVSGAACALCLVPLAQKFNRSRFCPDVEQNKLQNRILVSPPTPEVLPVGKCFYGVTPFQRPSPPSDALFRSPVSRAMQTCSPGARLPHDGVRVGFCSLFSSLVWPVCFPSGVWCVRGLRRTGDGG